MRSTPFLQRSPRSLHAARVRRLLAVAALAAAAFLAAASLSAAATSRSETWTISRIAGKPLGWNQEVVETDDSGSVTTYRSLMVLERLGSRVELTVDARTDEDPSGAFRAIDVTMGFSKQPTRSAVRVEGDALIVRTSSGAPGAADHETRLPVTGTLLGPEGVRRLCATSLRAPGDTIEYAIYAPEVGAVQEVRRRVVGTETIALPEGPASLLIVEETVASMGVKRTIGLDADHRPALVREAGPFGEIEVVRAGKAEALRAADEAELPPGMYDRSVARSNVRLPRPRSIERMRLRLALHDASRGWPDLDGDGQRVVERTDGAVVLEVARPAAPDVEAGGRRGRGAPTTGATATEDLQPYLRPNAWLESDNPEIVRIAREVAGSLADPWEKSLALTRWVQDNMKMDAGIVMAPASELVRDRRGTCAGFATLLATLLRAAGVPSRYLMGYVYYLGIWGGHAWVEANVEGRWIPLDAAVYAPRAADAARFAFWRGSLEEGFAGSLAGGGRLYGNLDVSVEAFEIDGRVTRVEPAAPLFTVAGGAYRNPGLGLSIAIPEGFAVEETDRTYPDPTIVALKSPEGRIVRLQERRFDPAPDAEAAARALFRAIEIDAAPSSSEAGGRAAWRASNEGRAALAFADGSTLYAFVADGAQAADLVQRVARGVRFDGR